MTVLTIYCYGSNVHTKLRMCAGFSYLQEPADGLLVLRFHGDHIFKEPEERSLLTNSWLGVVKDTVELEEQASSTLCMCIRLLDVL